MGRIVSRKQLIAIVAAILILGGALLVWMVTNSKDSPGQNSSKISAEITSFEDEQQGISFEYVSQHLAPKALSEQDKKDNIIASFNGGGGVPMLVTVQYEEGLSKVSNILKREPIDIVLENSAKVLPQKYPDYKKESERKFEYNGKQAAEIIFTYTGNNEEKIKQKLFILLKDRNTAFYMLAQSRERDFAQLETEVFDTSFQSLNVGG